MALHAIVNRSGADAHGAWTLELSVEGSPIAITLGPGAAASASGSAAPDARVSVSKAALADFFAGKRVPAKRFVLSEGRDEARKALLAVLGIGR